MREETGKEYNDSLKFIWRAWGQQINKVLNEGDHEREITLIVGQQDLPVNILFGPYICGILQQIATKIQPEIFSRVKLTKLNSGFTLCVGPDNSGYNYHCLLDSVSTTKQRPPEISDDEISIEDIQQIVIGLAEVYRQMIESEEETA